MVPTHLRFDLALDLIKRVKQRRGSVWLVRRLCSYSAVRRDPAFTAVCGARKVAAMVQRGQGAYAKITCSYCKRYYEKFVGWE